MSKKGSFSERIYRTAVQGVKHVRFECDRAKTAHGPEYREPDTEHVLSALQRIVSGSDPDRRVFA